MIVVLPFENLGPDDQDYFAQGMTDAITNRLAGIPNLAVISRTSAVQYANSDKTIRQMGAELGVDYVLEGTVLRAGDQIRITPQLIRVADDTHLWAEEIDRAIREPSDIFDIHSEIAEHVTRQLDLSIFGSSEAVVPVSHTLRMDAYEAYLAGVAAEGRPGFQPVYLELAVQMFERAVELDPDFALAWAKLTESYAYVFGQGIDRSSDLAARARVASERADELSRQLPETRRALGIYYYRVLGDDARASRELELAAQSLPHDSGVLLALGGIHRRQGDFDGAMHLYATAARHDPRSSTVFYTMGWTATYQRQYEKADDYYGQAIALAPDNVTAYGLRRWNAALWKGPEAAEELPQPDPSEVAGAAWFNLWNLGRYEEALQKIDQQEGNIGFDRFAPREFERAWIYTAMGEEELAAASWNSARLKFLAELDDRPDDDRIHSSLGLAYAGLGKKALAMEHGRKGLELNPPSRNAMEGPTRLWDLARIYALVGETELALETLEELLSIPADFSVRILETEPFFASLRDHPDYDRLVAQYR